jgi:hypothetical protein
MDRDKAEAETRTLALRRAAAEWAVTLAMRPGESPELLFGQLRIQVGAGDWRQAEGGPRDATTVSAGN